MSTGTICKVAPFFSTDPMTTPGYKVQKISGGALVDDVAHVAGTGATLVAISGITNGYAALPAVTLNADGSYEGVIVWDNGASLYVPDRISIPRNS